jgi:hypothetical protein
VLLVAVSACTPAAEFYVSPLGSDTNPGTESLPFATISRAQQAVRAINRPMTGDINVWLRGGVHRLPRPLMFGPEDSGANGFYVTYAAYPHEKPIVSGGTRITGWRASGDPARKIYVASAQGQRFRQLYVGDTRGIRARFPNLDASTSYLTARAIFQGPDGYLRVDVDTGSLGAAVKSHLASPAYRKDMEIVMYYSWNMSRLRIARGADTGTGTFRLVIASPDGQVEAIKSRLLPSSTYKFHGQRFHLENHRGFVNAAYEWYLDPADDLVYFRAPDTVASAVDVEALGIVVPMGTAAGDNETFVTLRGRSATGEAVRNLRFERLILAHSNWLGPGDSGFVGTWATTRYVPSPSDPNGVRAESAPAVVVADFTENIEFTGNVFHNLGGSGIDLSGTTTDVRVVGNAFLEVNGNGVQSSGTGLKHRVVIESNMFRFIGWDYHGAAVRTNRVHDLQIRRNDIDFTTHAAVISQGGSGGGGSGCYEDSTLSGPTGSAISANTISRAARRVLDMGAIYNKCKQTLAITHNTITNVNAPAIFSDIPYYALGGIGAYLDFGSWGVTVEGNTVLDVAHPFHLNCESNNTIVRNRTDLAAGTESAATPRSCAAGSPAYGPSTTSVSDSNSSTVPVIPSGVGVGMRPSDVTLLDWLRANLNRDFRPSSARSFDAPPDEWW